MINQLTRRAALCAVPAILTPLATLAGTANQGDDPMLPLYREWLSARKDWLRASELPGNGNFDHPASLEASGREEHALELMIQTVPTSLVGIAALVHALWALMGAASLNEAIFREECQKPHNRLLIAIWKATTGREGVPERA